MNAVTSLPRRVTRVEELLERVLDLRAATPRGRALLVALSGIDGAGKGYLAERLRDRLVEADVRTALVGADAWLRLPHERFDAYRPAEHFYARALRLDEMFERLVLPLRERRSLDVVADFAEETACAYRRHRYAFQDVDVVLVEGIQLLKRAYREHYDLAVWIDCTFETALERALARRQEGLSAEETVHAYRTIYFPAQTLHFELDDPRGSADMLFENDPPRVRPQGRQREAAHETAVRW
jgi:uridine kinase